MFPFQRAVASLTVLLLLIGNFAGWVHVGCVSSSHCMCIGETELCCSDDGHGHGTALGGHHASGHASDCCHHGHPPDVDQCQLPPGELTPDMLADAADEPSGDSSPAKSHDSDRCSVCQNFYTARNAAPVVVAAVCFGTIGVALDEIWVDVCLPRDVSLSSISLRGPPQV
ncbi:hypothetical protein V7x_10270 [Crateriforma conspicua]|uniref:Uncharacterized protein n=1 Tax=Crateriforma conspicua TaxID=2527996 RepID=A0A5C6FVI8_9PLAN|nr:hypothetical protein [Crateriforma conspicua]TWU65480.1 hypothetical protein V7x_10270 [Crateriforma conspicua]